MASISASHLRGSALYFFFFMALGSISPFTPLIWRSKGISDHQVGMLGAIQPICSFIATPIICAVADSHNIQQQVFYATMMLFTITRPSLLMAGSFLAIGLVEAINAIVGSPIGSLIDSAIIHSSGGDGYGTQRVWGAMGFGVSSLIAGYVSDAAWGGYDGVMVMFVTVMVVAMIASVGIPIERSVVEEDFHTGKGKIELLSDVNHESTSGRDIESRDLPSIADEASCVKFDTDTIPGDEKLGQPAQELEKGKTGDTGYEEDREEGSIRQEERRVLRSILSLLLSSSQNLTFFIAVALSGMGSGVIDTFLFIRLEELGGSHLLCGVARLIMCLAEVPVFYLSGAMIRCMGVKGVIALAQTAYLIRFMYYSVLENPWWVLPAEVLHGLTFAAMWAASTNYAHEISPAWLQTTIQGVISGLHWGLGTGLGAVMGGILYASLGARLCFRISSVLPLMSLLLVALPSIWRRCRARRSQQSDEVATVELISKKHSDKAGDDWGETVHNTDGDGHYTSTEGVSDTHIS